MIREKISKKMITIALCAIIAIFVGIGSISAADEMYGPNTGLTDPGSVSIISFDGIPYKLSVVPAPSHVIADNSHSNDGYNYLVVQLQDKNGDLVQAPDGGLPVILTSSDTTIGKPYHSSINIPAGDSSAITYIIPTYKSGPVTITASTTGLVSGSATVITVGSNPYKLSVISAPDNVNADGSYYDDGNNYLIVQLQDQNGRPALAPDGGIAVILTSSDTTIGEPYHSSIMIPAGSSSGQTYLKPTNTAGLVTISASSAGLLSGSVTVTTISPSLLSPEKLAVIPAPSRVNADNSYSNDGYNYLVVQLQDINGHPAAAPAGGATVYITSSDTAIGEPYHSSITIPAGDTSAITYIKPTFTAGVVNIMASSAGLTSGSAIVRTVGANPYKLSVIPAPVKVYADNSYYYYGNKYLVVQLQDEIGNPALAPEGGMIVLLNSSDTTIGKPYQSSITILAGDTSANTYVTTTYTPGSVNITASSAGLVSGSATVTTVGEKPYKLSVIPAPSLIRSDNSYSNDGYNYLVVQLQDENGHPALAPDGGVIVLLTSSDTTIGKPYQSSITIPAGDTSANTYVTPTYKGGSVTITASSGGLVSGSATVTTVGANPYKLSIIPAPYNVNADGAYYDDGYNYLLVQLQDENGNPALAPDGGIIVFLSSSDTNIGEPYQSSITIPAGDSSGSTYFVPTITPGIVTITASSFGLVSGSTSVTTVIPSVLLPEKLVVIPAPIQMNADNSYSDDGYNYLVVQLQDVNGNPAPAPAGGETVILTSSDTTIGKPYYSSITIPAGDTSASTYVIPTYKSGSFTITASSGGLASGSATVTTVGPNPYKLSVMPAPLQVNADNSYSNDGYNYLVVQLQDEYGNPALAPDGGINVIMTSSDTTIGEPHHSSISIPAGDTSAVTYLTPTYTAGFVTITASSAGLVPGSAIIATGDIVPALSVYTDKTTYSSGDVMHMGLDITNPGEDLPVRFMIWLEMPGGSEIVINDISLTLPSGLAYSNPNFKVFPLPSLAQGTYKVHAAVLDPATNLEISHDTSEWLFV